MKKILLILSFCVLPFSSYCQIPNSSFETWYNNGMANEPLQWSTSNTTYIMMDMLINMLGGTNVQHPTSAHKDASPQAGSFSLKLTNVVGNDGAEIVDTLPGIAVLGTSSFLSQQDKSGIPYTQRPAAFTGYYKFKQGAPGGSTTLDTAVIGAGVTKWNPVTEEREIIGIAMMEIYVTQNTSYQFFSIDFEYENGSAPDTLTVVLGSSTTQVNYPGTELYIDNIGLTGLTGINIPFSSIVPVQVYPNPATTDINLKGLPEGTASIEVKDLTGRSMKDIAVGFEEVNFSTRDLPSGLYYYDVRNESGDVLYTGKFDVKN